MQQSQLLTYIRLHNAAQEFATASPDRFSRASTSTAPRHWPVPCRSRASVLPQRLRCKPVGSGDVKSKQIEDILDEIQRHGINVVETKDAELSD